MTASDLGGRQCSGTVHIRPIGGCGNWVLSYSVSQLKFCSNLVRFPINSSVCTGPSHSITAFTGTFRWLPSYHRAYHPCTAFITIFRWSPWSSNFVQIFNVVVQRFNAVSLYRLLLAPCPIAVITPFKPNYCLLLLPPDRSHGGTLMFRLKNKISSS